MKKKKNILFIHYNADSYGSFAEFTLAQMQYFQEKFNIFLMIPRKGGFEERLRQLNVRLVYRGLHEFSNPLQYLRSFIAFAWFLLWHQITLVVILDYIYWKPAELLAAHLSRTPIVTACHFYQSRENFQGYIKYANVIIANSHKTKECFSGTALDSRVQVIHNVIDIAIHRQALNARDTFCPPHYALVGFVGALRRLKGVEYFIDAMPSILQHHQLTRFLIVGGEHDAGYQAELQQRVTKLQLDAHVVFVGHRDDIPSIMKSLDILVVPSLEEPFGLINLEAGIAGTPVVASNVGGIPEVIVNGETGILVPTRDATAIARACNQLLADPEERERMGVNAIKRVEQCFSLQAGLQAWENIINAQLST